jgi:hypothetical protein
VVPSDTQSFVGKSIASRASRNQRTGLGSLKQLPHSGNAKRVASISNEQVIEMFEIFLAVFIGWVAITLAGLTSIIGVSSGHGFGHDLSSMRKDTSSPGTTGISCFAFAIFFSNRGLRFTSSSGCSCSYLEQMTLKTVANSLVAMRA